MLWRPQNLSYVYSMENSKTENQQVFEKIAVAVAFSPRIEAILAQAKELQNIFNSHLLFIHVGEHTLQQEQYLTHLLHRFGLDLPHNKIVWDKGEPVEAILAICQKEHIDLLVAGALEKESILKYVMGSVARKLSRRVKCSMLMLTEPSIKPNGFKNIVVEGTDHSKTENTISVAIALAKAYRAQELNIIQESDPAKLAIIRSDELLEHEAEQHKDKIQKEEDEKIEEILRCSDCGELQIKLKRIEGKPGYVITQFARENAPDLLVLNSPDRKMNILDRVFPHDIEHALADLPCNLLIVNPKQDEEDSIVQ